MRTLTAISTILAISHSLWAFNPKEEIARLVNEDRVENTIQLIFDHYNEQGFSTGDLNADGVTDAAIILSPYFKPGQEPPEGDEYWEVLEFSSHFFDDELGTAQVEDDQYLCIAFGKPKGGFDIKYMEAYFPCISCGGASVGRPEISVDIRDGLLSTTWYGGSSWRWDGGHLIRYEDGEFCIDEESDGWGHIFSYGISTVTHSKRMVAKREYTNAYAVAEEGMEVIQLGNECSIFPAEAQRGDLRLDGVLDEEDWQDSGAGFDWKPLSHLTYGKNASEGDLDGKYRVVWTDRDITLALDILDDHYVPVRDAASILKGDHVEIWFDTDYSLVGDNDQLRTKPDRYLLQIGVGFDKDNQPVIRNLYPDKEAKGVAAAISPKVGGYTVEIQIPREYFKLLDLPEYHSLRSFEEGRKIGFALLVSDTDDPQKPRQELMKASTDMKWGNPWTFGILQFFNEYQPQTLSNWK